MNDVTREDAHSALYFGDTRDDWWNLDHLQLLVKRWKMEAVVDVLDVGAGVGHWGRLVSEALPGEVHVRGVEREPKWVAEATQRAQGRPAGAHERTSFAYVQGDATKLPFEADSFDLVTCQTLLIHLADPHSCVLEMARVLRPGGHLLLVEPNNIGTQLGARITHPLEDIDEVLRESRIQMICERGKSLLGLGFNSLGEELPKLIDRSLFEQIDLAVCDRASSMFAPYETRAQQNEIREQRQYADEQIWMWPEAETRSYYEAGGGTDFAGDWGFLGDRARLRLARIERGELTRSGGQLQYLAHARRR